MSPARRSATMLGILLGAMVLYGAWYAFIRTPSTPEGYVFPRHPLGGSGPAALYEGALHEEDGCVTTEAGDSVVWPGGYWLELREDGSLAVRGGGREARWATPCGWAAATMTAPNSTGSAPRMLPRQAARRDPTAIS